MKIEIMNKTDFINQYNVPTDEPIDMFPFTDWYLGYGLGCFYVFKLWGDIELEKEYVITTDIIPENDMVKEVEKRYKIRDNKIFRISDDSEV